MSIDHELDKRIIEVIVAAHASGTPITAGRGPFYDRQLKAQLGLNGVHQSVVCARMNVLLATGMVRTEETGELRVAYLHHPRQYPVVRFLPSE